MDKNILKEYVDACELIRDTEKEIRKLQQKKKTVVQTSVKGSMHEFPYAAQRFKVEGTAFTTEDDNNLRLEEKILDQQKENAEKIKLQVQEWMLTIPLRMQRIVRYRFIDGLSWEQVAAKMGRKATADNVRKQFEIFIKEE